MAILIHLEASTKDGRGLSVDNAEWYFFHRSLVVMTPLHFHLAPSSHLWLVFSTTCQHRLSFLRAQVKGLSHSAIPQWFSGMPLREGTSGSLYYSTLREMRLFLVFQKEKENWNSIQALHYCTSFWPPKTWYSLFSERYCLCYNKSS